MGIKKTKIVEEGEILFHCVNSDGTEFYINENNEIHRPGNKPAFIGLNGFRQFFINNALDRTDGPAVIFPDDSVEYWLNDIPYSKEDYDREIKHRKTKN